MVAGHQFNEKKKKKKISTTYLYILTFSIICCPLLFKKKGDLKKYFNIVVLTSSNIHINNYEKIHKFSNSLGYKSVINLSNQIKKLTPDYSLFLRKDLMNKFKNYEIKF